MRPRPWGRGPGVWTIEGADVAHITASGQDEGASGAELTWTPGRIRRDQYGHVTEMIPLGDEADSVNIPQNLGDLADVDTAGASEGDVLIFQSGQWVPGQAVMQEVVTDVAFEGGELKQTKREVRVLEVTGSDTSTIVETEECPE